MRLIKKLKIKVDDDQEQIRGKNMK